MNFYRSLTLLVLTGVIGLGLMSVVAEQLNAQPPTQSTTEFDEPHNPGWVSGVVTPQLYLPIVMKPVDPIYIFDDFSDPNSGWKEFDGSLAATLYDNGEYRIVSAVGAVWRGDAYHQAEDFEVSVDCRLDDEGIYFNGTGYCIIVFGNSATGVHEFAIDSAHNWYLYHIPSLPFLAPYEYEEYTLLASGNSGAIRSALTGNHLRVIRQNGAITLFVNDTQLYNGSITYSGKAYISLKSLPIQQNSWGYDARFDNYELIEIP